MSESLLSGITRILKSSKGIILLVAIVAVAVLVGMDKVPSADALSFIKWVLAAFFGAVALEDGAEKLGRGSAAVTKNIEENDP